MDQYYILVILLMIIAAVDLVVGVSNDAVNFLNSAVGSKVASRNVILFIAALGILVGASFSSGMMSLPRTGIFNPEFFTFSEVMVIFMAVMITDIILLDIYNSLGMPTSTTVSIVFELLGAAVVTSVLILFTKNNPSGQELFDMINHDKAVQVISGIFLSVAIAFTIGLIVQWLSRLVFTFRPSKKRAYFSIVFGSVAMTIIVYFLLIKGAKDAIFMTAELKLAVKQNGLLISAYVFLIGIIVSFLSLKVFKYNPLKLVVLMGTFSLAMAFAGNDLVNFVGVPISGFQSYEIWKSSGIPAELFTMESLAIDIPAPSNLLYISGIIMVLTLWFSEKSRRVTETEIKLSSQGKVDEKFKPHKLSYKIVGLTTWFAMRTMRIIPRRWMTNMNLRFRTISDNSYESPAFDLVRASVNLMVASVLIAFASSLRLPLSTTYVSFMVAMGSSLADRAWGEGSAPYRVAGVLNVIGGWFLTALVAFFGAGLVAVLIYFGGFWVAVLLFLLAFGFLLKSNFPKSFAKVVKQEKKKKNKR